MTNQRRADGSLRHLLTLEGLTRAEIETLLEQAQRFVRPYGAPAPAGRALDGVTIANLFTEPSTRTRVSFELAGRRLGATVINIDPQLSSGVKGESMLDTVHTLESLHVDGFVIRTAEPGLIPHLAAHVGAHVSVFSGGEAHLSHPTQGLLDALTVRQRKGERFGQLSLAIMGDLRHSRVARSAATVFHALGIGELRLIAPAALQPAADEFPGAARYSSPEEGLRGADVVMTLRIQKERMTAAEIPDGDAYFARYGLTGPRLRLARPDAIVLHPQPMNRGIEIASEVADGPQSAIRDQVRNGVAVRMAVLASLLRPRAAQL
jgi:aspartate carbamoyltransferase catalytic subunit